MNRPIAMKKDGIQTRKRKQKGSNPTGKLMKTNSKNDSLISSNLANTNNGKHQKSTKILYKMKV